MELSMLRSQTGKRKQLECLKDLNPKLLLIFISDFYDGIENTFF